MPRRHHLPKAKHWCFTINNPILDPERDNNMFWDNTPGSDSAEWFGTECDYLVAQEEVGENGTRHLQGYLVLKKKHDMFWLKSHASWKAHWEVARGTPQQNRDYCTKEETRVPGGFRVELGELPRWGRKRSIDSKEEKDEAKRAAIETLATVQEKFVPLFEMDPAILLQPGFIPAYKMLTADVLGPYRPHLRIVTIIGRPGTGKSFGINKHFPNHGRCIAGNNGIWFQQPLSSVMVFEEFCGQIQLQRMLQFLDPYPLALEVKGAMYPAMYDTVIITSNTRPNGWYKTDETDIDGKRSAALNALYDRLNFCTGDYIPVRDTGTYLEIPDGLSIEESRDWVDNQLHEVKARRYAAIEAEILEEHNQHVLGPWVVCDICDERGHFTRECPRLEEIHARHAPTEAAPPPGPRRDVHGPPPLMEQIAAMFASAADAKERVE